MGYNSFSAIHGVVGREDSPVAEHPGAGAQRGVVAGRECREYPAIGLWGYVEFSERIKPLGREAHIYSMWWEWVIKSPCPYWRTQIFPRWVFGCCGTTDEDLRGNGDLVRGPRA